MNNDQLKDMLMKKIDQELFAYKQNLIKNYTPDEIIQEAYKINFKEQIRDILDSSILDRNEIKALLKTENVLDKVYGYWENSDGNIWELLEDKVNEKIENMTIEYEKRKEKAR